MKAWKVEKYCVYFPLFKLYGWVKRFAVQPQTVYLRLPWLGVFLCAERIVYTACASCVSVWG